ncbi:MAG: hypothetical protein JKY70_08240 [Mucilaginibacter sp.]|nr:hypothetical protein [Mucilaginibacter sp.]
MKIKLLMAVALTAVITGCKKQNTITPIDESPVPGVEFAVSGIFEDNMVLQRNKPIDIWGTGKPGSAIDVKDSWNTEASVTTDSKGFWTAILPATVATDVPQSLTISTPNEKSITIGNILIGDVWICSGQSNMNMPLGNVSPFGGVENYQAEIAAANYPQIRSFTVKEDYEADPKEFLKFNSDWIACSPQTATNLSAVAYYFARKINIEQGIPVGIIVSAVNGSWCETWSPVEVFNNDRSLDNLYNNTHQSSQLYNGMINPLRKMSITGFNWYQGENNQNFIPYNSYSDLNVALIKSWRDKFIQGDLPFNYVQIAPFDDKSTNNPTLDGLARFREAQANVRAKVTKSSMVVTMDVGDVANHHPKYKRQVGERLATIALNRTYGKEVAFLGPKYQSYTQTGALITIKFESGTSTGLTTVNNTPLKQFFFVAGADKVFRQGEASINGDEIVIRVPKEISQVVAVRYAFTNYPVTNLQNVAGLPAEPFRTDSW